MSESLRIGGNELARKARIRARKYYRMAAGWQQSAEYWARRGDQGQTAIDLQRAEDRRRWARDEMRQARSLAQGKGWTF